MQCSRRWLDGRYYFSLIVLGNYIVMNLFLAILLDAYPTVAKIVLIILLDA